MCLLSLSLSLLCSNKHTHTNSYTICQKHAIQIVILALTRSHPHLPSSMVLHSHSLIGIVVRKKTKVHLHYSKFSTHAIKENGEKNSFGLNRLEICIYTSIFKGFQYVYGVTFHGPAIHQSKKAKWIDVVHVQFFCFVLVLGRLLRQRYSS